MLNGVNISGDRSPKYVAANFLYIHLVTAYVVDELRRRADERLGVYWCNHYQCQRRQNRGGQSIFLPTQ